MKKKMIVLLIGILLISSILTACGGQEEEGPEVNDNSKVRNLEGIVDRGKIVLGTSADYPPFEFHAMIDGKDEIVGFDIEIAKYIADELGVELEIEDMDFDKLLGGLSTGMLDIAIASMNPDPTRKANFSDIYYEANLAVVISKDKESEFTTIEDLNGKSIGVQLGTTQEAIAQDDIKDSDVKSLSTNPDIIMNLKTAKVDCAIMDKPVAESFVEANDDLMLVKNLEMDGGSGGVAIAMREGNDDLTERINEILAEIKSKGLIEDWLVEANKLSEEN